jgi:hypothetical protein
LSLLEGKEGEDGSSRQCNVASKGEEEGNLKKQKADHAESTKKVNRFAASSDIGHPGREATSPYGLSLQSSKSHMHDSQVQAAPTTLHQSCQALLNANLRNTDYKELSD